MTTRRVLVHIEAVGAGWARLTMPSWEPDVSLVVRQPRLPTDLELSAGSHAFVRPDLGANTARQLVASLHGWKRAPDPLPESELW